MLNLKVFVDIAAEAKLVTQMSSIFLKCCRLYERKLEIVVLDRVDCLLAVHGIKKVGNHCARTIVLLQPSGYKLLK